MQGRAKQIGSSVSQSPTLELEVRQGMGGMILRNHATPSDICSVQAISAVSLRYVAPVRE